MLFVKAAISLLAVHAVAATSYSRLGFSCNDVDIASRLEGSNSFENEQDVKEACNEDMYCHGYIKFGNVYFMVDSIGDLGDFRNSCRGFPAYMAQEEFVGVDGCKDTNRHKDEPKSCRPFAEHFATCNKAADIHCCACGGGERLEGLN